MKTMALKGSSIHLSSVLENKRKFKEETLFGSTVYRTTQQQKNLEDNLGLKGVKKKRVKIVTDTEPSRTG